MNSMQIVMNMQVKFLQSKSRKACLYEVQGMLNSKEFCKYMACWFNSVSFCIYFPCLVLNWESRFWITGLLLIIYLYQQNCESQRYVKLGLHPRRSYIFTGLYSKHDQIAKFSGYVLCPKLSILLNILMDCWTTETLFWPDLLKENYFLHV